MDTNTVKWFLSELEVVEPEQLETGEIEVICEDSEGREGVTYFSVTELAKHSSKLIETLEAEIHHLLTELNDTQPMVTLEHTSEPDMRHYHFYTENQESGLGFSGVFSLDAVEQDNFNPSELMRKIKEQTCKLAHENEAINSKPEDWAVKSLSRL